MEVRLTHDGFYMVSDCSQIITSDDAIEMVQEEFDITVKPGWVVMELKKEGEEQLTNYSIIPPDVWNKMRRGHK